MLAFLILYGISFVVPALMAVIVGLNAQRFKRFETLVTTMVLLVSAGFITNLVLGVMLRESIPFNGAIMLCIYFIFVFLTLLASVGFVVKARDAHNLRSATQP